MMSKKARPIFAVLLIGGILSVCSCRGNNDNDSLMKQQQLLVGIGMILEQRHYSPRPINDSFSEVVFNGFLSQLDGDKNLFMQSDVDALSQYKDKIDDEIHGDAPMRFYPSAVAILKQRVAEAKPVYTKILSQPFDFTKDEMYQPIGDSLNYPADSAAWVEAWRLRLKYRTLQVYSDLLAQKESAKSTDSIKQKTDADLQTQARDMVKKSYDKYFESKFNPKIFDATAQFSMFTNVIAHAMDPHTDYFAPVEERSYNESISNKFYGIGAQLGDKNGLVTITSIVTGGAAWKSKKINVGDAILKVQNGSDAPIDLVGYTALDAVKVIRGAKGSTVTLTIKKVSDGSVITISLIREEIKLSEMLAKSAIINEGGKKIGFLHLPEFYVDFEDSSNPPCSVDIAKELKKLTAAHIDGLIFDLRDNPGGSLQDVNKIIGYFVPKGPAVQVRNRAGNRQELPDGDDSSKPLYTGPLVVMINEFSASASEIFAAAMQDYHRAIIVGSPTSYGKGTVQNMLPLGRPNENGEPEFGSLKMTIEKFYRINGGSTQMKGVSSDVVMPDIYESVRDLEKDNTSALPWDKIEPASYAAWNTAYNKDSVIRKADERISENPVFKAISATNTWMDANSSSPISLNIAKYKARQLLVKNMMDKDVKEATLKTPLSVSVMQTDHDKFYNNPNKMTQEYFQGWLKDIAQNVYIKESVKIVNDMIGAKPLDNIAKK
ncbi:hypothetical protein A9P82_09365 [Arachidicoccus ginsenosidimutans]|uniref:carboxy terminal-processing peptidase n=1 Tax=Arachidicoccus sp. BS20 TaxID=1850526 RepID=UPI0007F06662|nr:carboxy terminal-processing peptidase [Arachidicoccus sp. BS20]ANI90707.1 hypothetical protein A9P82_09365 [Arachidicoccus sp. BS20]